MKRIILILLCVVISFLVALGAESGRIVAPGVTGMNSDADPVDLRPTDARFLLNTNTSDFPGQIESRYGHAAYGENAVAIASAVGVYDELTAWKVLFGITPATSMTVGGFQHLIGGPALEAIDSTLTFASSDTVVGLMRHTTQNGDSLIGDDSIPYWWFSYEGLHDYTGQAGLGQIHVGDAAPAVILQASTPTAVLDSTWDSLITAVDTLIDTILVRANTGWPLVYDTIFDTTLISVADSTILLTTVTLSDTIQFLPRLLPLSPEQPGALRVFGLNNLENGSLDGLFQYAVAFKAADWSVSEAVTVENALDGSHFISTTGPPSNIVSVVSGGVVLTNFPRMPEAKNSSFVPDSTICVIYRKDIRVGGGFRAIDSIAFKNSDTVVYVDMSTAYPAVDTASHAAFATPGAPFLRGWSDSVVTGWENIQLYWVGFSVLDTTLGLESALSPLLGVPHSITGEFAPIISIPVSGRWDAVRVYHTVANDNITGADDSTIVWCAQELTVPPGQLYTEVATVVGNLADTALVNVGGVIDGATGVTLQRPPYLSQLSTTLSDMAYWDARLWGIGDPEFPSRLYFSGDEDQEDWLATNSYDLDPDDNDRLIAIETISIGAGDAMLACKRRKTFLLTGETLSDVEFLDGRLWTGYAGSGSLNISILTASIGAISKDLVVGDGDAVYVVTNDLHCVRFRGTRPDTISLGVWVELKQTITDSTGYTPGGRERQRAATSYSPTDVHARMMIKNDKLLILNQFNSIGMAWEIKTEQWSKVQYSFADVPTGTVKYDTVSSPKLFGDDNDLFYFDDAALPLYVERDTLYVDSTGGYYKVVYRAPTIIDPGWWIWLRSISLSFGSGGPTVNVRVLNEDNDTLAARTFTVAEVDGLTDVNIGLPHHAATELVIEITADSAVGRFVLYEYTPDVVRIGQYQRK